MQKSNDRSNAQGFFLSVFSRIQHILPRFGRFQSSFGAKNHCARAHTHTYIHSLCRRRRNVQVTCLARARTFSARGCIHLAFTQFGAVGVAGSQRGKPEDEDTELATIQKGPKYFMQMWCIATCTSWHICNHCNYIAYIAYLTHFL